MAKPSSKSKAKIRILLADDHHVVRAGIRQLLESAGDLQVIAEAGDGQEAQTLIQKHKPDVAVLDIQMPKASGIEVTRWVRAHLPAVGGLRFASASDPGNDLSIPMTRSSRTFRNCRATKTPRSFFIAAAGT